MTPLFLSDWLCNLLLRYLPLRSDRILVQMSVYMVLDFLLHHIHQQLPFPQCSQIQCGQIHPERLHFPSICRSCDIRLLIFSVVRYFLRDKPFLPLTDEVSVGNSTSFHHNLPALFYHQSADLLTCFFCDSIEEMSFSNCFTLFNSDIVFQNIPLLYSIPTEERHQNYLPATGMLPETHFQ